MNEHLTDQQITELLASSADDAVARRHLEDCHRCAEEFQRVAGAIGDFAELVREEAGWRQLRPVSLPGTDSRPTRPYRLVCAVAIVLVAVAVCLLRWTPAAPNRHFLASQQPEDTLLLEIQEDLNREVPDALAPALVLTAERNRIIGQEQRRQNR